MASEEMLEAKIGLKMASGCGDSLLVGWAIANQHQRLTFLCPLQRVHVEGPEVALCFHDERSVLVEMLCRKRSNFRGPEGSFFQIPFRDGGFGAVDGLHGQLLERAFTLGNGSSCQESRELRNHRQFRKVACPHAQVSVVCHG